MQAPKLTRYLKKILQQDKIALPRQRLNRLSCFKIDESFTVEVLTHEDNSVAKQFMLENLYREAPLARALKLHQGLPEMIKPVLSDEIDYFLNREASYGVFHENKCKAK